MTIDLDDNYTMTIDGKAVKAARQIEVINPATATAFSSAPDCSREQLDDAVKAARYSCPT